MKRLTLLILTSLTLIFSGCGKKDPIPTFSDETIQNLLQHAPAQGALRICTLEFMEDGTYLICDDGTSQKLSDENIGSDGSSCTLTQTSTGFAIDCEDGTHAEVNDGQVTVSPTEGSGSGSEVGSNTGSGSGSEVGSNTGSGSGSEVGSNTGSGSGSGYGNDGEDEDDGNDKHNCHHRHGVKLHACFKKCEGDKQCKRDCLEKFRKHKRQRKHELKLCVEKAEKNYESSLKKCNKEKKEDKKECKEDKVNCQEDAKEKLVLDVMKCRKKSQD